MMDFIRKHRNALLLGCLLLTLAVSWLATSHRLEEAAATIALPVEQVTAAPSGSLEQFRAKREETTLSDMAVLEKLCAQENLSASTREDAARQLQRLIAAREAQLALEGALTQSGISPCVAVVGEGSVTIVTDKADLSDGESALVLTLAQTHAGVAPSGVRVITASEAK